MKTFQFFKKTATVLAVASVALAGCGDDGGGSGTTGWVDSDPSVVEATSVEGAPKDVAEVQVMVSGGMSDAVNDQLGVASASQLSITRMASSGYGSLVTGGYEKGKFKLNLPKSVDEEYLSPMSIFDMLGGFTVSNPDAMHAMVAVQALDEDGEFLGAFAPMDMNKQSLAFYVYCDASCSVKGSIEEEAQGMNVELSYNCSFKKGWNFMYISVKESNTEASVSCTTSKLSGANYKWTFVDKDGDF